MALVSEAPRPLQRIVSSPARLAAVLLLFVWIGPVTFVQMDVWRVLKWIGAPEHATAESMLIPSGEATLLQPGTMLKLRLRDRSVVRGRYLGRTLLDSTLYASRFESYARAAIYVPILLGETLHVALRDGREWTAPFAGYAELALLLRAPDGTPSLRVPFEFARSIHRADGAPIDPGMLTRAFRDHRLPSAEALGLEDPHSLDCGEERWTNALRVAFDDIRDVSAEVATADGGGEVAGAILLGVVVAVVVFCLLLSAMFHPHVSSSGCEGPAPGSFVHLHLTDRPFDRSRGCFVGDEVAAMVDPCPAQPEARGGGADRTPGLALAE